mgnify:CR=1 FL=1
MLRKAGNFLRYLFGILMMLAGAGYWKEEKAYALSLLLLGIFLLPVTWNTIKKRFHVAKALPVLLPVLLLVSACALTPVTYSSKETQKASAESVSVSVTAAPTKKRRRPRLKHQHQRRQQHRPKHQADRYPDSDCYPNSNG